MKDKNSALDLSGSSGSTHESVRPSYRILIDILLNASGFTRSKSAVHGKPLSTSAKNDERTAQRRPDVSRRQPVPIHHLGCGGLQSSCVARHLSPAKRICQESAQIGAVAQK
jgi:hypothetical protein